MTSINFLKSKFPVLLVGLAIVLALLRFVNLGSDPVNVAVLHNEDEGNYSYNTRNLVLENKLVTDDVNFFFVSPLWTAIQFPVANLLGVKFESFRFPAAASSVILMAILSFFAIYLTKNRIWVVAIGLLTASNFLITTHSRIAMPETTTLLFLTGGFISWYFALLDYPQINFKYSLLTGVLWSLAFFSKGNGISLGIYLVLSLALTAWYHRQLPNFRDILKLTIPLLVFGAMYLLSRYLFNVYFPNQFHIASVELTEKYRPLLRSQILNPAFWYQEIINTIKGGEAKIWQFIPFLTLGTLGFLTNLVRKIYKRRLTMVDLHAFALLLGSLIWFILITYKPARYFMLIVPALIICFWLFCKEFKKLGAILIVLTVIFDLTLSLKYIYLNQTFSDVATGQKIAGVVKNQASFGKSLGVWMLNNNYHVLNTYFLSQNSGRFNLEDLNTLTGYFDKYYYPDYLLSEGTLEATFINNNSKKFTTLPQGMIKTEISKRFTPIFVYKINKSGKQ